MDKEEAPELDILVKLPNPADCETTIVTYYDTYTVEEDDPLLPNTYLEQKILYRTVLTIAGPGETNTGEAWIRGEEPAKVLHIFGWSDEPTARMRRVPADRWQYLKDEFRRPKWEEYYGDTFRV